MKVLIVIFLLTTAETCGYNSVLNFPGPPNVEDYVLVKVNSPPLSAYTVCTWILKDFEDSSDRYFFSYATKTTHNEIVLGDIGDKWVLWAKSNNKAYADEKSVRNQWYHTCYRWSISGEGTVFVNGVPGKTQTEICKGKAKLGDGMLALGQDQDVVGGKFDKGQAFIGQLYNLNFWNRVLSTDEIVSMYKGNFCGKLSSAVSEGIIVSWGDIVDGDIAGAAFLQDAQCPGYNTVLNFPGPPNIEDYVLVKMNSPPLSAYTVCTWILKDFEDSSDRYFFSYATKTTHNEIVLGDIGDKWVLWAKSNNKAYADETSVRNQWYHTCYRWSISGEGTVFVNGVPGKTQTEICKGKAKLGDGMLALGQDQDVVGGKFDKGQAFIGQLYNLNFWNRVLSTDEIVSMYKGNFCGELSSAVSEGIIVSWADIVDGDIAGAASLLDAQCF